MNLVDRCVMQASEIKIGMKIKVPYAGMLNDELIVTVYEIGTCKKECPGRKCCEIPISAYAYIASRAKKSTAINVMSCYTNMYTLDGRLIVPDIRKKE